MVLTYDTHTHTHTGPGRVGDYVFVCGYSTQPLENSAGHHLRRRTLVPQYWRASEDCIETGHWTHVACLRRMACIVIADAQVRPQLLYRKSGCTCAACTNSKRPRVQVCHSTVTTMKRRHSKQPLESDRRRVRSAIVGMQD